MIRLFNVSIPPATFILLIFESLLLSGSFVVATLAVSDLDPVDYLLSDYGLVALALVVLSFLLGLHFQDLYSQIRVKSRVLLVQQLCMVTGAAFLAQGLISYLDSDLRVSVRIMLVGSAIAMPAIFLWRLLFGTVASQMIGQTRLVMIGRGPILTELREWIDRHPEAGLVVEASAETLDEMSSLDPVLHQQLPPRLVFAASGKPDTQLTRRLLDLQLAGYELEPAAATYEKVCGRVSLYSIRPGELIFSNAFALPAQRLVYQVVLNGVVAGICLVVTMPLMIVTALLLRAGSRGPILRGATRTGWNGRHFQLYRFLVNGDGVVPRMVRKLRLDGIPQFLNVLKGDLAVVGPRAERPEYLEAIERYIPFYRERYLIRPGITGWAQTHLDGNPGSEDVMARLEHDLYYIKHMSLGLDTLILLHAIKSILVSSEAPPRVWAAEQVSAGTH